MVYLYDGTFAGFLTAVHRAYYGGTSRMEGIRTAADGGALFGEEQAVETCPADARAVGEAFTRCCGRIAAQWLYRAFLSEAAGREEALFEYIRLGFRCRKNLYAHRMEPWVWQVFRWASATGDEAGKFLGLVRFSELAEGMLYSEISPTHDILPLLGRHFQRRLGGETWAIHDVRRRRALFCEKGELILADVPEAAEVLHYSGEEQTFRALWQRYYKHLGIAERRNPDLRRSWMPEKYWAHLTEMEDPENRK